ncbi:unnamed protein product, partial [Adineta steineri]
MDIHGYIIDVPLSGFYTSVFYVNSLLLTQLQCLYNQSCVTIIRNVINESYPHTFTALSQTSRFPKNITIDFLSKHLFTESWSQNPNYKGYFEQCQPHSCSYTTNQRRTFVLLMMTVIGLSSTVSIILRFISPFIISFILKRCQQTQQTSSSDDIQRDVICIHLIVGHFSIRTFIVNVWRKSHQYITTLNIFENVDKPNPSDEELNAQRKWTRAYIVVLIVIMTSVVYITMLSYQTVTTIVDKPTLDEYANLPKSADCLCTNLSIPYHTFINFNPQFHEICKSHFIEPNGEWMSLLYDSYKYQRFNKQNLRTFQRMALFHFQAIQAMCRMVIMAVNNELTLFLNSTLTTVEILESDLFEKKIN